MFAFGDDAALQSACQPIKFAERGSANGGDGRSLNLWLTREWRFRNDYLNTHFWKFFNCRENSAFKDRVVAKDSSARP